MCIFKVTFPTLDELSNFEMECGEKWPNNIYHLHFRFTIYLQIRFMKFNKVFWRVHTLHTLLVGFLGFQNCDENSLALLLHPNFIAVQLISRLIDLFAKSGWILYQSPDQMALHSKRALPLYMYIYIYICTSPTLGNFLVKFRLFND